jgi:hypothetical protein
LEPDEEWQETGGGLLTSVKVPVSYGGPDTLRPVGMTEIVDAGEGELLDVTAHELGEALLAVSPAPALAERTSGIELAGEAKRASATKLKVLVP